MINNWVKSGNDYFIREVSQNNSIIPVGIYKVNENPQTGEIYITHVQDKFDFPYKIYGIETDFINRVKTTYDNNTGGNLGLLLNGVKGTGKTVTSKQICNALNIPVLLIHAPYVGIPSFINEIQQNVIIFIDEFEKIYHDHDHTVLTVMDGALDNGYRKVFLLTTNQLYVNDNLLQRPGRVRYLKTYGDLTLSVITEIVDNKLTRPELREDTIEFISNLEMITVDIVKAIVDEVNIHNEAPNVFKDVFNIKTLNDKYNVFEIESGTPPKLISSNTTIYPRKFIKEFENDGFEIGNKYIGRIKAFLDDKTVIVEVVTYTDEGEIRENKQFMIENVKQKHYSFVF
jgi:hypothetical protein